MVKVCYICGGIESHKKYCSRGKEKSMVNTSNKEKTCYMEAGCAKDYPGPRSKKLGYIVGCIGCPNCGATISGKLSGQCGMCDYEIFTVRGGDDI